MTIGGTVKMEGKRNIKTENAIIKEMVEKINGMHVINKSGRTVSDYIVILTTIKFCWYKGNYYKAGQIEWEGEHGYDFTEFDEPILGDMCKYVRSVYDSLDRFGDQMNVTTAAARKIAESVLKQIKK